ncbi:MAG: VCBS repeat-containing protein, partial [Acidobacteriota bacterium]
MSRSCQLGLVLLLGLGGCGGEPPGDAPAPPAAASPSVPPAKWLSDVTQQAGIDFLHAHGGSGERYMVETMGGGGGFFDFDDDGWLDLYLVQSGPLPGFDGPTPPGDTLYRNRGRNGHNRGRNGHNRGIQGSDTPAFEHHPAVPAAEPGYGMGACFADVDNDGHTDVYLTRFGPDRLLRNEAGQSLTDITETAGIDNPHWAASCAFADYDRDGCLDLYVVNYVDFTLDNHRRCAEGN